jgi:hypothetical protein
MFTPNFLSTLNLAYTKNTSDVAQELMYLSAIYGSDVECPTKDDSNSKAQEIILRLQSEDDLSFTLAIYLMNESFPTVLCHTALYDSIKTCCKACPTYTAKKDAINADIVKRSVSKLQRWHNPSIQDV